MVRRPRMKGGKPVAERLVDAAELLIGQSGVDGVSLRQIGAEAGTVNNYAVQYHFGDMDGMVRAIFELRMPSINARMVEQIAALKSSGSLSDNIALLQALMLPLLDQRDDAGERSFARFLSALLRSTQGRHHFENVFSLTEQVRELVELLSAANSHVPIALLRERLRLSSILLFSSVFNRGLAFDHEVMDEDLVADTIAMIAVGIAAPVSPNLACRI